MLNSTIRICWILSLFFWLIGSAAGQSATITRGGALPVPLPLFPPDNWWNVNVSKAPLEVNGNRFITWIQTSGRVHLHPDYGGDPYGMIYITVPGTQPLEQVVFGYADESDKGAPGRPGYPIPVEAQTQPDWIEGCVAGGGSSGDRHMLIVDVDHRILFELYATEWNSSLGQWEAGSGAIFPLDSNLRRPEGWTSADAAGLAILPGLVRYDEAYGSAPIRHAFRFTTRDTNSYVYPASHSAGSNTLAPPMGTRFRLKASTDISGYAPPLQKIFQAMKDYGLIVADNGSDMYITGTNDSRWDMDLMNTAFNTLYADDFEVVKLGWIPPNHARNWTQFQ